MDSLIPLIPVIVGGLLAIVGGFLSTVMIESRRRTTDSRNLALAFKGEITALLHHIEDRSYANRFQQVIEQMEATQTPFFMPFRIRFAYDSVYQNNVAKIGLLQGSLPEMVPTFYTYLRSMMEDLNNIGDGAYAKLDLEVLLRIHRDLQRVLAKTTSLGEQIIQEVDRQYPE